jgi:transcriptional regulator with XRE-family HTH domain
MGQTALGLLLEHLREERGLKLRELGQISTVDHAYIHRLESGDKESPSEEVLSKLIKHLRAGKREADMLRYLAEHTETDPELMKHVIADEMITYEIFRSVASVAFRGHTRPDYPKLIERVRRILGDENGPR